jgi:rhodanese-related sulfurtransferase
MITESSPAEFKNTISRPEVEIIDVRSHAEFINEHIHGAKNVDITSPIFDLNARLLQKPLMNHLVFFMKSSPIRMNKRVS